MVRLILSIVAGFIVTAILSTGTDFTLESAGILPPYGQPLFDTGLLLLATTYRALYQVVGSYVAARAAKESAHAAVWTLGILGAVIWLAGGLTMQDLAPLWYSVLGAVLSLPTTLLGGKLNAMKMEKTAVSK
jgi:ABC-type Fe3+-siderophore transport system permease subunit